MKTEAYRKTQRHYHKARRLKLRLGVNEADPETHAGLLHLAIRTQPEVAAIMGISRERVRQLERMALYKIRATLQNEIREVYREG
jgi:DNA-directed RNA polymerase sigma subunit (sigma70/sigma32)